MCYPLFQNAPRILLDSRPNKHLLRWHIKDRWSQTDQSWNCLISLGSWFSQAVSKWLKNDFLYFIVPLTRPPPDLFLFTDASLVGWGAHPSDLSDSGQWSAHWKEHHINVLEHRAVWLTLKSVRQFQAVIAVYRQYISCCLPEQRRRGLVTNFHVRLVRNDTCL